MNEQEWQALRNKANGIATDEYSTHASSLIKLTKTEIEAIISEANVDNEKLSELISVVNDHAKSNAQKAEAIKNATGLAETAVALIGKLV